MSIRVAPGSDIHNTIRPANCPAREGWREICDGFHSGGRPDHDRLTRSFTNGCYQQILFLGVSGFVICNHWDKEILLVDPWPTYASFWTDEILTCDDRSLRDGDAAASRWSTR